MSTQGGTVYLANTPIPSDNFPLDTIGPELLQTLKAIPTYTTRPTRTPRPTATGLPPAYPPPTTPPWDQPGTAYP